MAAAHKGKAIVLRWLGARQRLRLAGFGLVPIIGFTGVCLGSPIAWLMADAFLIPAYFHVSKVLQKRMVPQTDVPQAV